MAEGKQFALTCKGCSCPPVAEEKHEVDYCPSGKCPWPDKCSCSNLPVAEEKPNNKIKCKECGLLTKVGWLHECVPPAPVEEKHEEGCHSLRPVHSDCSNRSDPSADVCDRCTCSTTPVGECENPKHKIPLKELDGLSVHEYGKKEEETLMSYTPPALPVHGEDGVCKLCDGKGCVACDARMLKHPFPCTCTNYCAPNPSMCACRCSQPTSDWEEEIIVEVLEDYLYEAKMEGAGNESIHLENMRGHFEKLKAFIRSVEHAAILRTRDGVVREIQEKVAAVTYISENGEYSPKEVIGAASLKNILTSLNQESHE